MRNGFPWLAALCLAAGVGAMDHPVVANFDDAVRDRQLPCDAVVAQQLRPVAMERRLQRPGGNGAQATSNVTHSARW